MAPLTERDQVALNVFMSESLIGYVVNFEIIGVAACTATILINLETFLSRLRPVRAVINFHVLPSQCRSDP